MGEKHGRSNANDSYHNGQDINNVSATPTLDQSCACVKSCNGVSIDLALPTFENLPGQNVRAHLESLIDYLKLKNVPSQLHLLTAMKSFKRSTVTTVEIMCSNNDSVSCGLSRLRTSTGKRR
jgi:hypothetical protein